jgi:hypothetical protein
LRLLLLSMLRYLLCCMLRSHSVHSGVLEEKHLFLLSAAGSISSERVLHNMVHVWCMYRSPAVASAACALADHCMCVCVSIWKQLRACDGLCVLLCACCCLGGCVQGATGACALLL